MKNLENKKKDEKSINIDVTEYFSKENMYIRTPDIPSIKFNDFNGSKDEVIGFRIGRYGRFLNLPLKLKITPAWFYISELIRTDGHIHKSLCNIKFTNKDLNLINYFVSFFKSLGIQHIRVFKEKSYYRALIFNRTFSLLFINLFGISSGNKSYSTFLPDWMKKSNRSFLVRAVAAAFDGDGTIDFYKKSNTGGCSRKIRLYSGSKRYIHDVGFILKRLKIDFNIGKDPRKDLYFLQITRRNYILRFYNMVTLLHKDKSAKMFEVINSYKPYLFLPEFEKLVVDLINEYGPIHLTVLGNKLGRSVSTISDQIRKLERDGKIVSQRVETKKIIYPPK